MARGQAERLFPMLEEVLAEGNAAWSDLSAIAVGTGPGNFTGIRISISAARGLALSLDIPAVGVSGFEALRGVDRFGKKDAEIVSLRSSRGWFLQKFEGGEADGPPIEKPASGGWPDEVSGSFRAVPLYGYDATAFEELTGGPVPSQSVEFSNRGGLRIAERIAAVAALKLVAGQPVERPSPVYVRPADAAPASDPPPVILQ